MNRYTAISLELREICLMMTPDAPQAVTATAAPIKATVASWLDFCKEVEDMCLQGLSRWC